MSTVNIVEYAVLGAAGTSQGQASATPFLAVQNHTLATTSTQSNAFNTNTKYVEVNTDAACFIIFGTTTASITASTTNGARLVTGETRRFAVVGGGVLAAVIP